jgi:hypothetical protein
LDIAPGEDKMRKDMDVVKDQILELNEKFDYLMFMLIKSNKIAFAKD